MALENGFYINYQIDFQEKLKSISIRFNDHLNEVENRNRVEGYFNLKEDSPYIIDFNLVGKTAEPFSQITFTVIFLFDHEKLFELPCNESAINGVVNCVKSIDLRRSIKTEVQEIKQNKIDRFGKSIIKENLNDEKINDLSSNWNLSEFDNEVRGFQKMKPNLISLIENSKKERKQIGFQINQNEKKDKGGEVTLFYATNRNVTQAEDSLEFGNDLSDLTVGKCAVNIPPGHRQGEIERPEKFLFFFQLSESMRKHVLVNSVTNLDQNDFMNFLKDRLDICDEKSAILFIHGYNTSFEEAAWRTAQITYDLPFYGISGFFSWPSTAKALDYLGDQERARASESALGMLIDQLLETGVSKLHFIAHSMGNMILTETLCSIIQKPSVKSKLSVFNQIILAAPDIDVDVFKNTILPGFKSVGSRRTIYASDNDHALILSKTIRGGRPRIGDAGEQIFMDKNVDTIDASNVDVANSTHSYMFETVDLLYDLNMLVTQGLEPAKRRLVEVKKDHHKFYLFRK